MFGVSRGPLAHSLESRSGTWLYCSHAVPFQTCLDFFETLVVKFQFDVPIHSIY